MTTSPDIQYLERRMEMLNERIRKLEETARRSELTFATIKGILQFIVLPVGGTILLFLMFGLGMNAGRADAEAEFKKQVPQQQEEPAQ